MKRGAFIAGPLLAGPLVTVSPREASVTITNFRFNVSQRDRVAYGGCACGALLVIRFAVIEEGTARCDGCRTRIHRVAEA